MPSASEINGNLVVLNALAGIPLSALKGFRAPFLNYSVDTLKLLYQSEFTYDSSATASIPVTEPETDAYWPYTLDDGMANNCLSVPGTCQGEPKLPGFWEIPMYAFFDELGVRGPHVMDPWLWVYFIALKQKQTIWMVVIQGRCQRGDKGQWFCNICIYAENIYRSLQRKQAANWVVHSPNSLIG